MASRPLKWRILAVVNGVDLPTNGEATTTRAGPLQEFLMSPGSEAEVRRGVNLLGLLRAHSRPACLDRAPGVTFTTPSRRRSLNVIEPLEYSA
jgi:hypothetical protein